jgi:hypothetical protein
MSETCGVCGRKVRPEVWDSIGYECPHTACPHRKGVTAAPPADWGEDADGTGMVAPHIRENE